MSEYQSIVRIVNKLCKDGYKFRMDVFVCQPLKEETPAVRSRSRGRCSPLPLDSGDEFIHVNNLPHNCTLGDIKECMPGILIKPSDVAVLYDLEGNFLKEAIVRLHSNGDLLLALGYSGKMYKGQPIISMGLCC
eukprot:TRINITY_DN6150_c0_g1_i3.p4 TRINITY_DN6150_c0_g1~~TRINITY_DN6150_c0_g1_i3.p4  ORF type:complete len:134 (-),score=40.23 TRINITY_DN6150_c0_g1_i3:901-1302(-)